MVEIQDLWIGLVLNTYKYLQRGPEIHGGAEREDATCPKNTILVFPPKQWEKTMGFHIKLFTWY